jgi:hypothetical protein
VHAAGNQIGADVLKALEASLKDPLRVKKAADEKLVKISSWLQALRDGATELDLTGPTRLGGRVGAGPGSHANAEPC